jgi:hypothetical protein
MPIARPKAAAIWCPRMTAQDCFVAALLAMTLACSVHL